MAACAKVLTPDARPYPARDLSSHPGTAGEHHDDVTGLAL
jgi:hypothetical protein